MSLITAARLQLFAPRSDYMAVAPRLDRAAARCGIDTPRRVRHWLAHVYVETLGLTRLTESLSYSAQRLCQVWPKRFPTIQAAQVCAMAPRALAAKVYAGRMGNLTAADAANFIGRGGIMRTGRAGYAMAQASFAEQGIAVNLIAQPELLASNAYAWDDAANFWAEHGLNQAADADAGERIYATVQEAILGNETDDLETTTKAVNGGLTGWPERLQALQRAGAIWRD